MLEVRSEVLRPVFEIRGGWYRPPPVYEQVGQLLDLGCECVGWQTDGAPRPLEQFVQQFPQLTRVYDWRWLIDHPDVALIVAAAVPDRRADLAMEAMRCGKDVLTGKPGCTTLEQLEELQRVQAATGRIWSVGFSERFAVRSLARPADLIAQGAVGRLVHTV